VVFLPSWKYGRIVTPTITRRLVGSVCPILPAVCIAFWRFLLVSALSGLRPKKKKGYTQKKTQKSFVTLLPMAERLASHVFHGNKTHILTLLPFVTAPIF
jgi:hypothetical protein